MRLDLSTANCHVCGNGLVRDPRTEKEWCTHHGCSARGVEFSIPYIVPIGKEATGMSDGDKRTRSEQAKSRGLGTLIRPTAIFAPSPGGYETCRHCGKSKPWDDFRTNKGWSHGKASICKDCANIAKHERRHPGLANTDARVITSPEEWPTEDAET